MGDMSQSARKHRDILAAATKSFLEGGFLGASMDEIAQRSGVSKQTVYKHFGSKEALFIEVVTSMTGEAGDRVHSDLAEPETPDAVAAFLHDYAVRQLSIVLSPELMQLRRVVVGEVGRFPELGAALYERGPRRAVRLLAETFKRLSAKDLLRVTNPHTAAVTFNWLVMGEPINRAMLLGEGGLPSGDEISDTATEAVRVFLAAYGKQPKRRKLS